MPVSLNQEQFLKLRKELGLAKMHEKLEIELTIVDDVNKPTYQGEKFTKASLLNKNKHEDEEGNTKVGAMQGQIDTVSVKVLGDSSFFEKGKKYKVTIEAI